MKWKNTFKDLPDEKKKELVQKAYDLGYKYEQEYGNCPQCTLAAVDDVFGCVDAVIFKCAYCMGGGLGLTTMGTCGALNAATMIISSLHGRDREHFQKGVRYPECYELSRRVYHRFVEKYGVTLCNEVHKKIFDGKSYVLSDPEQFQAFEEAGGHDDKCPAVVGEVCKFVAEMIVKGEI